MNPMLDEPNNPVPDPVPERFSHSCLTSEEKSKVERRFVGGHSAPSAFFLTHELAATLARLLLTCLRARPCVPICLGRPARAEPSVRAAHARRLCVGEGAVSRIIFLLHLLLLLIPPSPLQLRRRRVSVVHVVVHVLLARDEPRLLLLVLVLVLREAAAAAAAVFLLLVVEVQQPEPVPGLVHRGGRVARHDEAAVGPPARARHVRLGQRARAPPRLLLIVFRASRARARCARCGGQREERQRRVVEPQVERVVAAAARAPLVALPRRHGRRQVVRRPFVLVLVLFCLIPVLVPFLFPILMHVGGDNSSILSSRPGADGAGAGSRRAGGRAGDSVRAGAGSGGGGALERELDGQGQVGVVERAQLQREEVVGGRGVGEAVQQPRRRVHVERHGEHLGVVGVGVQVGLVGRPQGREALEDPVRRAVRRAPPASAAAAAVPPPPGRFSLGDGGTGVGGGGGGGDVSPGFGGRLRSRAELVLRPDLSVRYLWETWIEPPLRRLGHLPKGRLGRSQGQYGTCGTQVIHTHGL
ncbi:hypothetical protein GGR56DRAFT_172814 [Xylariaceae sp. FL0804]|nr:hypothetical protein GGR56DRAFT_172814 [Xylariaceae sp. FL0804]